MDKDQILELDKAVDRVGDILAAIDTKTNEDLAWFFGMIANHQWTENRFANSWDEAIQARAVAQFIENRLFDLRATLQEGRQRFEDAKETNAVGGEDE